MTIHNILDRTIAGYRLDADNALVLLQTAELETLAQAAHQITVQRHPEPFRTYNIERNINYTNICMSGCKFCAFFREPHETKVSVSEPSQRYVMSIETLFEKIAETVQLGGNQILLQGGLHPTLPLSWYEHFIKTAKAYFPNVNIHGFSPTEIVHLARLNQLTPRDVLDRLRDAGLGSLPGGGAEILVDRVRRELSPNKASTEEWLGVCRDWHKMGGRGSATMMFGHIETLAERIEHLTRLRELQDETSGFTAFICWTFQPGNTQLSYLKKLSGTEYLKMLAVSRLYLDNFNNLQASWVTQGMQVGTEALHCGANDMGSIMIEENVVAAAGTVFRTNEQEIRAAIESAGYIPKRRDVFYTIME